jgi:hypothetical protein
LALNWYCIGNALAFALMFAFDVGKLVLTIALGIGIDVYIGNMAICQYQCNAKINSKTKSKNLQ